MGEIWKQYQDSPYQVSTLGRVKGHRGQILKSTERNGYLRFSMYDNSKKRQVSIHRLVAETFIDNPQNKPIINHINGIKSDNRVENLEWVTYSENITHALENGLKGYGQRKIDIEIVKEIRKKYKKGIYGYLKLSKEYDIPVTTIRFIIFEKTYSNVI